MSPYDSLDDSLHIWRLHRVEGVEGVVACALWTQGILKNVYSFTNARHVDRYNQLGTTEEEEKVQEAQRVCAKVVPASH